jgi:hypothetical protein
MKTVITRSLIAVFRTKSALILTALALGILPLVQRSQAVNPPPDGGYAGGNTAEGQGALLNLTTGTFNTAVGLFSLKSNTKANSIRPSVRLLCSPIPQTRTQAPVLERF